MFGFFRTASIAALTFLLGVVAARIPLAVRAAAAPLAPVTIDLASLGGPSAGNVSAWHPLQRRRTLVSTDGMTVQFAQGIALKYIQANTNEVQIILRGSGTEWLGDHQVPLYPGLMLVIPKGTAGRGSTDPGLTYVSIKTPPEDPADVHPVP